MDNEGNRVAARLAAAVREKTGGDDNFTVLHISSDEDGSHCVAMLDQSDNLLYLIGVTADGEILPTELLRD